MGVVVRYALLVLLAVLVLAAPARAVADPVPAPPATATQTGEGGAVASVDPYASTVGLDVLKQGGNAVDAAIAAAGALGVVEPYSCGIGGGGFMVVRRPNGRVHTIDSRETAPAAFQPTSFIDPATNAPIPLAERITSGLGVGVPGTVRGWELALDRWGTKSLVQLLKPSVRLADRGFVVDRTLSSQTEDNLERFRDFTTTRELFLTPEGDAPAPGATLRNPGLARAYKRLGRNPDSLYHGVIAQAILDAVRHPPVAPGATRNVRPGLMAAEDLGTYTAKRRAPTRIGYRGYEIVGMGPPSSGGSTVGEALNILEGFDLSGEPRSTALHRYLEASRLAYADRAAYLGDPDQVDVPLAGLLSDGFAAERRALIGPTAATSPVAPGDPWPFEGRPAPAPRRDAAAAPGGRSTTHLTVSDRKGMVVSYTFTIEQIGGSGIAVPVWGFLLNNELTDFEPEPGLANSPAPGKRPRSSMAPTIVLRDEQPVVALGSPGGAAIITTVLQLIVNQLDFGLTLPDAIDAPRASQRNTTATQAEPAFIASPEGQALLSFEHTFTAPPAPAEIGAVEGIAFLPDGRVQAAAEPERRGGGSAMVERPG